MNNDSKGATIIPFNSRLREKILSRNSLSQAEFQELGLTWDALEAICYDHIVHMPYLQNDADWLANLVRRADHVHSVRVRVKTPLHLVHKVIRKRKTDPQRLITIENYRQEFTDLIGVRALHLVREEWPPIHRYILEKCEVEGPVEAHLREGDPKEWEDMYAAGECVIDKSDKVYRSVHYTARVHGQLAEIQVRTIYDEAWSELDHRLRYPFGSDDFLLLQWLKLLNLYSGAADQLASTIMDYYKSQAQRREEQVQQVAALHERLSTLQHEIAEKIERLARTEAERDALRADLAEQHETIEKLRKYESIQSAIEWFAGPHPFLGQFLEATAVAPAMASLTEEERRRAMELMANVENNTSVLTVLEEIYSERERAAQQVAEIGPEHTLPQAPTTLGASTAKATSLKKPTSSRKNLTTPSQHKQSDT
jgi:putative GTP pyrophosphokinase